MIEVADDGVGADPAQVARAAGLGIALVRQRLVARFQSDEVMDIETGSGCGFTLRMSVPAQATAPHRPDIVLTLEPAAL